MNYFLKKALPGSILLELFLIASCSENQKTLKLTQVSNIEGLYYDSAGTLSSTRFALQIQSPSTLVLATIDERITDATLDLTDITSLSSLGSGLSPIKWMDTIIPSSGVHGGEAVGHIIDIAKMYESKDSLASCLFDLKAKNPTLSYKKTYKDDIWHLTLFAQYNKKKVALVDFYFDTPKNDFSLGSSDENPYLFNGMGQSNFFLIKK